MGKSLSINEVQDIMRDDQLQFDKKVLELKGEAALAITDDIRHQSYRKTRKDRAEKKRI